MNRAETLEELWGLFEDEGPYYALLYAGLNPSDIADSDLRDKVRRAINNARDIEAFYNYVNEEWDALVP